MIAAIDVDRIIAERIARRERWESLLPRKKIGYTRSRLFACDDFEVLALLWFPGARTPIHDHGASYCATRVLSGELQVARYHRSESANAAGTPALRLVGQSVQHAGEGDVLDGALDLHSVANATAREAISIHLYAPRYAEFGIYDESGVRLATATARYDAVFDF
ncbi:MAG: cysteine dioxygenase [Candidatus Baltobacteraceae bacterium]